MNDTPSIALSKHARFRGRQRAIPDLAIELLVRFGTIEKAPGGASKVFFDKAARKRLHAFAGTLASSLDPHLDLYAVLSQDDRVITIGHRLERIQRH